jgi:hypothetical protein
MKRFLALALSSASLALGGSLPAGASPAATPLTVWPAAGAPWRTAAATALAEAGRLGFAHPILIHDVTTTDHAAMTVVPWRGGPTTTIAEVRVAGRWEVTGATASTIFVTAPASGVPVGPTITLGGRAVAFEGQLAATVHSGGTLLATTVAHCGSTSLGPLTGSLAVGNHPGATLVLTVLERSARDGSTAAASVVAVRGGLLA